MLRKLNLKKDRIVDIQAALGSSDMDANKQVEFDEWRDHLKKLVFLSVDPFVRLIIDALTINQLLGSRAIQQLLETKLDNLRVEGNAIRIRRLS